MKDMLAYLEKFIIDRLSDAQENLEEHISDIKLSVNEEAVEVNSRARDVTDSAAALEKLVNDLNSCHIPTLQKHREMTESICKSQKMTEVTLSAIQAQLGSLTSHLERNLQQQAELSSGLEAQRLVVEDLVAERQKGEERCKDAAQSSSQKRPRRDDDEPGPTEQPPKRSRPTPILRLGTGTGKRSEESSSRRSQYGTETRRHQQQLGLTPTEDLIRAVGSSASPVRAPTQPIPQQTVSREEIITRIEARITSRESSWEDINALIQREA